MVSRKPTSNNSSQKSNNTIGFGMSDNDHLKKSQGNLLGLGIPGSSALPHQRSNFSSSGKYMSMSGLAPTNEKGIRATLSTFSIERNSNPSKTRSKYLSR